MNFKILIFCVFLFSFDEISCRTWIGNFDEFPSGWRIFDSFHNHLRSIVRDPFDEKIKVYRVDHPKGSCSTYCGIPGGAGFDVRPFENFSGNVSTFEFSVFFHSTFNFVKGGKLPGIIGATANGPWKGCSGCNTELDVRTKCFSARFMWGPDRNGYPYLYLPLNVEHELDLCRNLSWCKGDCGWSYKQTKYFERNKWTKIKQRLVLNTPGKNDGRFEVWVDGVKMIDYTKMNYRTRDDIGIVGFTVHPFFGGSGYEWATPEDTFTLYKDFQFSDF